jgi:hypothetical protein
MEASYWCTLRPAGGGGGGGGSKKGVGWNVVSSLNGIPYVYTHSGECYVEKEERKSPEYRNF